MRQRDLICSGLRIRTLVEDLYIIGNQKVADCERSATFCVNGERSATFCVNGEVALFKGKVKKCLFCVVNNARLHTVELTKKKEI